MPRPFGRGRNPAPSCERCSFWTSDRVHTVDFAGTHMLTVLAVEMESILSVSLGFLMWYAIAVVALALGFVRLC